MQVQCDWPEVGHRPESDCGEEDGAPIMHEGPWCFVYGKSHLEEDGSKTVEVAFVNSQKWQLNGFSDLGGSNSERIIYSWDVPYCKAQDIIDECEAMGGTTSTASSTHDGLINIICRFGGDEDPTVLLNVITGCSCSAVVRQSLFYGVTDPENPDYDVPCPNEDGISCRKQIFEAGEGKYNIIVTCTETLTQDHAPYRGRVSCGSCTTVHTKEGIKVSELATESLENDLPELCEPGKDYRLTRRYADDCTVTETLECVEYKNQEGNSVRMSCRSTTTTETHTHAAAPVVPPSTAPAGVTIEVSNRPNDDGTWNTTETTTTSVQVNHPEHRSAVRCGDCRTAVVRQGIPEDDLAAQSLENDLPAICEPGKDYRLSRVYNADCTIDETLECVEHKDEAAVSCFKTCRREETTETHTHAGSPLLCPPTVPPGVTVRVQNRPTGSGTWATSSTTTTKEAVEQSFTFPTQNGTAYVAVGEGVDLATLNAAIAAANLTDDTNNNLSFQITDDCCFNYQIRKNPIDDEITAEYANLILEENCSRCVIQWVFEDQPAPDSPAFTDAVFGGIGGQGWTLSRRPRANDDGTWDVTVSAAQTKFRDIGPTDTELGAARCVRTRWFLGVTVANEPLPLTVTSAGIRVSRRITHNPDCSYDLREDVYEIKDQVGRAVAATCDSETVTETHSQAAAPLADPVAVPGEIVSVTSRPTDTGYATESRTRTSVPQQEAFLMENNGLEYRCHVFRNLDAAGVQALLDQYAGTGLPLQKSVGFNQDCTFSGTVRACLGRITTGEWDGAACRRYVSYKRDGPRSNPGYVLNERESSWNAGSTGSPTGDENMPPLIARQVGYLYEVRETTDPLIAEQLMCSSVHGQDMQFIERPRGYYTVKIVRYYRAFPWYDYGPDHEIREPDIEGRMTAQGINGSTSDWKECSVNPPMLLAPTAQTPVDLINFLPPPILVYDDGTTPSGYLTANLDWVP